MSAICKLILPNNIINLALSAEMPDLSTFESNDCPIVYENLQYKIQFEFDCIDSKNIREINAFVNGDKIGYFIKDNSHPGWFGTLEYITKSSRPFLLHYDLIILEIDIVFEDSTNDTLYSNFLLCVSKNKKENTNIQKILESLNQYFNSAIGDWIFQYNESHSGYSLTAGGLRYNNYKSLSSYVQLLNQIIQCYNVNYPYFRSSATHKIQKTTKIVPCETVKTISNENFEWLMQNSDKFSEVKQSIGINYNGKNYLPYKIQSAVNIRNYNIYENQIVVNFLFTVINTAQQILSSFSQSIDNEQTFLNNLYERIGNDYWAPIITIKSYQIAFCRKMEEKLYSAIESLHRIYSKYVVIFEIKACPLVKLPKKTKPFQELLPYIQVFENIMKWFKFGDYTLIKENFLLQIKTIDKLFEYYCLFQLLEMFASHGYTPATQINFKYKTDNVYSQDYEIPNTFILNKHDTSTTIYYQPVIHGNIFENDLYLYRTTKYGASSYYTPDFVVKFENVTGAQEYIILDAKFASRKNILNHYLSTTLLKYACEIESAPSPHNTKMIWILQGRVDDLDTTYERNNSELAQTYHPLPSYGVISINTHTDNSQSLWNIIKRCIKCM